MTECRLSRLCREAALLFARKGKGFKIKIRKNKGLFFYGRGALPINSIANPNSRIGPYNETTRTSLTVKPCSPWRESECRLNIVEVHG